MKKKMVMMLLTSMMMSLSVGCGSNAGEVSNQANEQTVVEGAKKVAIVQYVEHPSLDTIRESIIAELEAEGYVEGENITIDYQNAQADQSNLNTIASKFVGEKADLIVAIATPAAQAAYTKQFRLRWK